MSFSSFLKKPIVVILSLLMLFSAFSAHSQSISPKKPARILFLLDASGSMSQPWQHKESRFHVASRIVSAIMDSIYVLNPNVSFALRAFGEQYPARDSNCYDTKLEVSFGHRNSSQIEARMAALHPKGFSPIALSLKRAAESDFTDDQRFAYSIILITDGGESCGGDICAVVQKLLRQKISFTPYIITLIDYKPLLDEYKCLGKVLTVAKEQDFGPAIERIISNNRPFILMHPIHASRVTQTNAPVITKPVVKTNPVPKERQPKTVAPKEKPVLKPVVKEPQKTVKIQEKPTKEEKPVAFIPHLIRIDPISKMTQVPKTNLLFALPSVHPVSIATDRILTLPVPKPPVTHNTPAPVHKPMKAIGKRAANGVLTVPAYTVTENAQKTSLMVYFTDGHGKFYHTEPLMEILDAKTGKKVKQTYRKVSGGEPTPISINSGVYDIIIPGSDSKSENVKIIANKTNKVYIMAGKASLAFYYTTNPDSPARAYKAYVSSRFSSTRSVTIQPCDTEFAYSPANYHIEINTLPKLVYNIDLTFNQLKLVAIPTPGTFQLLNTTPSKQKVQLWRQLGNEFVPFMEMYITGYPKKDKVDLLPGPYQAKYFKLPQKPHDKPIIVPFEIKSNRTTSITIEQ